jgi:hypothetical protein
VCVCACARVYVYECARVCILCVCVCARVCVYNVCVCECVRARGGVVREGVSLCRSMVQVCSHVP